MAKRPAERARPHDAAQLPNAELDILAHLWNHGPSTSKQVREALSHRRPMALASALTFLARLERKGLVRRQKHSGLREYVYRPVRGPEPTYKRLIEDLTERVFGGSYLKLVSSLFKGRKPTGPELVKLREILDEIEAKHGTGR